MPACINCLKRGHTVPKCTSSNCRICSSSYNSFFHRYNTGGSANNNFTEQSFTSHGSVNNSSSDERVIFVTVVVSAGSSSGKLISAREPLNFGPHQKIITEELVQLLRLEREGGSLNSTDTNFSCHVEGTGY